MGGDISGPRDDGLGGANSEGVTPLRGFCGPGIFFDVFGALPAPGVPLTVIPGFVTLLRDGKLGGWRCSTGLQLWAAGVVVIGTG